MRAFKIDSDGITEFDAELDAILTGDTAWDCVSLSNGHDFWVDDFGLHKDRVLTAVIDDRHRIPLPAYVLAAEGERSVDATLTMEEVRRLVRIDRNKGKYWSEGLGHDHIPAIGFDSATDTDGVRHPWRAVLAFHGDEREAIEYLIRLPKGEYQTPTVHPTHGDLTELPHDAHEQAEAICLAMRLRGFDVADDAWLSAENEVDRRLRDLGVDVSTLMVAEPENPAEYDDTHGIGGLAGHEISNLFDNELRDRGIAAFLRERPETNAVVGAQATDQASAVVQNQAA